METKILYSLQNSSSHVYWARCMKFILPNYIYIFPDFSLLLTWSWGLDFWNLCGIRRQFVNFASDSLSVPFWRAKQSKKTPRPLGNRKTYFLERSVKPTYERCSKLQNRKELMHCLWNPTLRYTNNIFFRLPYIFIEFLSFRLLRDRHILLANVKRIK